MLRDDIEERVEAVVAKIDSLEARVERLEGKPDVTGKSVDGT